MSDTDIKTNTDMLHAVLIPDCGSGFDIEKKIECRMEEGHRYCFDIPEDMDIKALRMSLGNAACWCIIDRIDAKDKVTALPEMPCLEVGLKDVFNSEFPAYIIDSPCISDIKQITFIMRGAPLNAVSDAALFRRIMRETNAERVRNRNTQKWLSEKIEILEGQVKELSETQAAEQEPEKEGFLGRLKNRFAGSKKEAEINAEPEKTVHANGVSYLQGTLGSVDFFRCKNEEFYASGWIFDTASAMRNLRLAFYNGTEKKAQIDCPKKSRPDVGEVLGNEDASEFGFEVDIPFTSDVPLDVYVEYTTVRGTGGMLLGSLSENSVTEGVVVGSGSGGSLVNVYEIVRERGRARKQKVEHKTFDEVIDIIVPVYGGYDFLEPLFDSVRKTAMKYRLILVYDGGNDERVLPCLRQYADRHDEAVLLENPENMGFVKSTNRGLEAALEAGHHAVFLNTDVELPWFWLERLMAPIIEDPKTATSTPFTNSGTICSFPNFREDNPLFAGLQLWQVDEVFDRLKPNYPEMPTGVGFCMGVNVEALKEIGLLDAETFGKGYGEENDWCRRAMEHGFINVHVDNLFAYHKHGGSFPSEEKKRLIKKNSEELLKRHPDYNTDVQEYIINDPEKNTRIYAENAMLSMADTYTILAFDHNIGGGASVYLERARKKAVEEGKRFATVRYDAPSGLYIMEQHYKEYVTGFSSTYAALACDLAGHIDEIWINELVTYPDLYNMLEFIKDLKRDNNARLIMKMHDFFCMCPAVKLFDENRSFCGIGTAKRCDECLQKNENSVCYEPIDTRKWREKWGLFLKECDEITIFSESTGKLLLELFDVKDSIKLVPHVVPELEKVVKDKKSTDVLNIGVIGAIDYAKGWNILKDLSNEIVKSGRPARIVQFGILCAPIESDAFESTGRYEIEELPKMVAEKDVDIFIIPAIWPETFSYTTSEIISMDMPIAVFDIGAPPERVREYSKGLVLPMGLSSEELLGALESFANKLGIEYGGNNINE